MSQAAEEMHAHIVRYRLAEDAGDAEEALSALRDLNRVVVLTRQTRKTRAWVAFEAKDRS